MSKQKQSEKPIIEITTSDPNEYGVNAILNAMPEGHIWAENPDTLAHGINYLMNELMQSEKIRRATNGTQGKFDAGMEGMWIEGEFAVRWLALPGFGVSFEVAENLQPWLGVLLNAAMQAIEHEKSA